MRLRFRKNFVLIVLVFLFVYSISLLKERTAEFALDFRHQPLVPKPDISLIGPEKPHRILQKRQAAHYLSPQNKSSDNYAPSILSTCEFGQPAHSAPCLAANNPQTNIIKGLELIYPPFKLAVPIFPSMVHKTSWEQAVSDLDRCRLHKTWMEYPTQYGQIIELENALYRGDPPADSWDSRGCMNDFNSFSSMLRDEEFTETDEIEAEEEILVVATSPDSWSFQHFLDRVTNIWQQAQISISPIDRNKTTVLSGRSPQNVVNELYSKMGVKRHLHNKDNVFAKRLVYSCRTPLIHPFLYHRMAESFGVDMYGYPVSQKKVVLYLARGRGDELNGGRNIVNEKELLESLRQLLVRRNQGEKLIIFDRKKFKNITQTIDFFNRHVKALIGPHGSAFHNGRFVGSGILNIEFMPKGRFQPCFWEQARLLDQKYVVYMLNSLNHQHDMRIDDIEGLVDIVDEHLGKSSTEENLQLSYQWKKEL